jgi:hypothetical protein
MENSIYSINKGVNQPIRFKGLQAQYIAYFGGGCVGLLILFAIFYFIGLNNYLSLGLIVIIGGVMISCLYRTSNTYGQFGMMKKVARRSVPKLVICRSRQLFTELQKQSR